MMTKMKNKKVVEKLVEKRLSRSGLKITADKTKKKPVAGQRVSLVPVTGLEPVRCRQRWILSPLRLPFHHTGRYWDIIYQSFQNSKRQSVKKEAQMGLFSSVLTAPGAGCCKGLRRFRLFPAAAGGYHTL